ncbi:hypothetical protein [Paenibacillus wynnii]|uniref:Uncharacterized protein n=1 Tax=Paenibacillus wynnii TaxID=268407 RepID=A0A098M3C4_9BACL|nr:hypothetical protein [Paenibacillus wynnii]KGE16999.1 hypothetical protein PWYN_20240 [Paenibacillus wynnii]
MNQNPGGKPPTKAEQALNSVETAHRSVRAAEEHPSSELITQADRSIRHAQAAVDQSDVSGSLEAAQLAKEQLRKDEETLDGK